MQNGSPSALEKKRNPERPLKLVMNSQLFELFPGCGRGDKYG